MFLGGRINRQPLLDVVFADGLKLAAGPFKSVKEFHDWLSSLTKEIHWPDPSLIPDPFRDSLPDASPITFTHADLHPSNILVSTDSPCRIVAIIDWHQSGWYPDYWEYCKSVYTAVPNGEWETDYVSMFLEVANCLDAWFYYPRLLSSVFRILKATNRIVFNASWNKTHVTLMQTYRPINWWFIGLKT